MSIEKPEKDMTADISGRTVPIGAEVFASMAQLFVISNIPANTDVIRSVSLHIPKYEKAPAMYCKIFELSNNFIIIEKRTINPPIIS
ncbi:hypothetical protein SDC9_197639 [bioreactor metagenome]|uniref:Uncharacterized protein n=1 Tax=bioreactor metagenome TaxID=1076179 RepID=A0A645INU6_9ZZZZ